MTDSVVESLILNLLEWVTIRERTYEETMDAWRTSCPKLPVWEEANDRGFLSIVNANGLRVVMVTPRGRAALAASRACK